MGQRVPATQAEQLFGPQPADAERAALDQPHVQPAAMAERRQQQRVDPQRETHRHAGADAAAAGAAPVQAADQAGGELRHRGERHQPVGREHGVVVAAAVVAIGHQRQQQDRQAADPQHARGDVGGLAVVAAAAQQQRHHQIVADHGRQRDRGHDHHAGRRGEATDVGDQRQRGVAAAHRQRQHQRVVDHAAPAEQGVAGHRDRHDHQRDQDQVAAEQPARAAHVADVAALHHRHVELARQADQRQEAEQGLRDEAHRRRALEQGARRRHHRGAAVGQPDVGEHPYRHHRQQLDHRFQGDGQHHAVVMLGGVHLAGAEQRGEQRHQQRHVQRRIGEHAPTAAVAGEYPQAHRNRLVLQRQVRHHADQRDHRHQRGQPPRTAVAGGNEIGDGDHVLAARDQRQPLDDAPAEQQQQQRPQVDRQVADAVAHRGADRAIECPRRAVHRQRKAVDHRPQPRPVRIHRPMVAPPRHAEQQRGIAE